MDQDVKARAPPQRSFAILGTCCLSLLNTFEAQTVSLTSQRLTKQMLAACMIFIAARSSHRDLKEMLLWSVPIKLFTMIVQIQGGGEWVSIGVTEGLTGLVNVVCAFLMD